MSWYSSIVADANGIVGYKVEVEREISNDSFGDLTKKTYLCTA